MEETRYQEWLRSELTGVAAALGAAELQLVDPAVERERRSLRETILRHLVPRTADPRAPLVVAVAGPAGSGTSSLVNSLAEARLCPTGAIRPGTRYPVFWTDEPLTGQLEALRSRLGGIAVAGERRAPEGMVVVDTPPPDVAGPDGTRPADAILEMADACVFVTSGLRYADLAGWDILEGAARRGIPVIHVLNKLPDDPEVDRRLREDFARRLAGRGMIPRPDPEIVMGIPAVTTLRAIGGPPPQVVTRLRKELDSIADPQARLMVTADVVEHGLADAAARLPAIRDAFVTERHLQVGLSALAEEAYRPEVEALRSGAEEGALADIRGDTDRLVADLVVLTTLRAGEAARAAADAWALHPTGNALVGASPSLWMHGERTVSAATEAASEWVASLPERVLTWKAKRRMRPRRLRRLADLVCRAAVDRDWVPSSSDLRRLSRLDGAVIASRRDLAGRLASVLIADGARFAAVLGPLVPEAAIERLGPPHGDGDG